MTTGVYEAIQQSDRINDCQRFMQYVTCGDIDLKILSLVRLPIPPPGLSNTCVDEMQFLSLGSRRPDRL